MSSTAGGESANVKLLLVDASERALVPLAKILDLPDRELYLVSSGAEAVAAAETHDFAVILLAVELPVMDGFATAAKLKASERSRLVPIIFITTGHADAAQISSAYESGGVDLVHRPFDAAIMRAKVAVFADLHQAREQVRAHEVRARGEAERLAASLVQADKLQQQFLSTLGQELRPPLNAILGWIRMLRDGSIREAQRVRALETVERNATAQLALIEEMIDISRMTSGTLALELGTVNLVDVVGLAVEDVRPLALEKQVTLFAALERDVVPLSGDAERLRQIAHRLVGNAVSCTPTEGVVTVSLCNVDGQVELAITDTGPGIEPELVSKVFDGFAGETTGTPRAAGGLGVGLAIVRHLVELHDGTIGVESAGPGLGCRFVVKLPVAGRQPRTDDEVR